MRPLKDKSEIETLIEENSRLVVAQSLMARIRAAAAAAPLYISFGKESLELFWYWRENGSSGEMEAHLRSRLLESEGAVDAFLDVFVGRAWGMESGISQRADFDRSGYDSVAALIDGGFIVERLHTRYGEGFKYDQEGVPKTVEQWHRRTASRFIEIHQFVLAENQKPEAPEEVSGD
jgi:hypothetical protein